MKLSVLRNLLGFTLLLAIIMAMACQCFGAVTQDANGWTVVTPTTGSVNPADDSRVIYVSSSEGNDANDGLSDTTPKETSSAGRALLRAGKPDHILYKRGDTFNTSLFVVPSGKSAQEPTYVGAYGTGARPKFLTDDAYHWVNFINNYSFIVIQGLHATPAARATDNASKGIRWDAQGDTFIVEDCKFDGYQNNLEIQCTTGDLTGVQIRRNIIVNAWPGTGGGHSQGLFSQRVDGMLVEENIFDHNGWGGPYSKAATIFNHNVYIAEFGEDGMTIRRNIFARGSNHPVKMELLEGTISVEDNTFIANGTGGQWGMGSGDNAITVDGLNFEVFNNVWVEGEAIANSKHLGPEFQSVASGFFRNNIVCNRDPADGSDGSYQFRVNDHVDGVGINNFDIHDNVFYNIRGQMLFEDPVLHSSGNNVNSTTITNNTFEGNKVVLPTGETSTQVLLGTAYLTSGEMTYANNTYYSTRNPASEWFGGAISTTTWQSTYEATATFTEPTFTAPTRTSATFATSVGYADWDAWMADLQAQDSQDWDESIMAAAVNDYIREGFDMSEYTPASAKRVLILQ